jgi:hypothetical protein
MKRQRDIKRRIAVALRRYIVERLPSKKYRVYFGCSQDFMRAFIRSQFLDGESWQGFGVKWKIGHVLAAGYFDMENENDRRLCWNWMNLRVTRGVEIRRILSADEALHILGDRVEAFPENEAIGALIVKAYELQGKNQSSKLELGNLRGRYEQREWTQTV